jgi:hypothetical protein
MKPIERTGGQRACKSASDPVDRKENGRGTLLDVHNIKEGYQP